MPREMFLWPQKDLGWWGFWIGLLALFLAVPLAVIGNILTPKILNWWAARSRAALEKRIAKLEAELADMDSKETITLIEGHTLSQIEMLRRSVIAATHYILGAIFASGLFVLKNAENRERYIFDGFMMFTLAVNVSKYFWRDPSSIIFKSSFDEFVLRKSIEKLKAEFARLPE